MNYIKRINKAIIIVLIIMVSLFTFGCNKPKQKIFSRQFNGYFNTVSGIKILYDEMLDFETILKDSDDLMRKLDGIFNRYNTNSEVYKVNKNAGVEKVKVSSEFVEIMTLIIEECQKLEEYNGKKVIDPTVGSLTTLWNFNSYNYLNVYEYHDAPKKEDIDKALELIDYKSIEITEDSIFLTKKDSQLDLGAFVKGYSCNKLKELLISHNVTKGVIDLGGNLDLIGQISETELFKCGIVNPNYLSYLSNDKVQSIGHLYLKDTSIVTSGSYERYIKSDANTKYHHILSLDTGYSCDNKVLSVTVISENSFICDAYSTSLFILGLEKGMKFVNENESLECIYVIDNDGKYEIYVSNGLKDEFVYNQNLNEVNFIYKGVLDENTTN